jgi:hypothetical protein
MSANSLDKTADVKPTTPLVPPVAAKPKEEFPNKRKYEDGTIFNRPMSFFEGKTEAEVEAWYTSGGSEPETVAPSMALIKEALAFHKTEFRKEPVK